MCTDGLRYGHIIRHLSCTFCCCYLTPNVPVCHVFIMNILTQIKGHFLMGDLLYQRFFKKQLRKVNPCVNVIHFGDIWVISLIKKIFPTFRSIYMFFDLFNWDFSLFFFIMLIISCSLAVSGYMMSCKWGKSTVSHTVPRDIEYTISLNIFCKVEDVLTFWLFPRKKCFKKMPQTKIELTGHGILVLSPLLYVYCIIVNSFPQSTAHNHLSKYVT